MSEEAELGYDALNDTSATYESVEGAEAIKKSLESMWQASEQAGAIRPDTKVLESVVGDFDPMATDRENGRQGAIVDKRIPIERPRMGTSEWRTPVGDDAAYRWSISRPEDKPEALPMLTLETPVSIGSGNFVQVANAARAGVELQGRRIQEYVVGNDGKIHGRSADYTLGGGTYRIKDHSQKSWEATQNEVAFIQDNLSRAELVKNGEKTGVTVESVAPELRQAA